MPIQNAFIPYGVYWSSPFCRWQGGLAGQHALKLAAETAARALPARGVESASLDGLVLGVTVPQRQGFYGGPWVAAMLGAPALTGPMVSQACATSARVLSDACGAIETGASTSVLALACDRTSNGPHMFYPDPSGPGGTGQAENIVLDSFGLDPWAGGAMVQTAENVARKANISRAEQDDMALLRSKQYGDALANDRAFQRRYMVEARIPRGKKEPIVIAADEGIHPTTAEGLAALRPASEGGTVTFGTQTHPADGNAAIVVCTRDKAVALSRDAKIPVRVLAFGQARVDKGFMPMAPVPAARQALERAGVRLGDVRAIKTHNPFAVNDVYFCREMDVPADRVNRFGSPLVYGHPQAPTGLRATIELIEELAAAGGGYGLFTGCAAGDSAMAVVIKVG